MNRLEQEAADALAGYEQQQKWRERVKADLARSKERATGPTWKPTISEHEKKERDEKIAAGITPF